MTLQFFHRLQMSRGSLSLILLAITMSLDTPEIAWAQKPKSARETEIRNQLEAKIKTAQEEYAEQQYAEAIRLLDEVLKVDPQHAVALYQRASARVDLGAEQKNVPLIRSGLADARQALALAGNKYLIFHVPYFYGMTTLTKLEGRPDHAQITIKVGEALLHRPDLNSNDRAMTMYQLGLAYSATGDYAKATARLESAIDLDSDLFAAHLERADAYQQLGDFPKALTAINDTIKTFPDQPMTYNNRATLFLKQDRLQEALRDYDKALSLEPEFPMAWFNRGYVRSLLQQWPAAIADYRKSLELDDEFSMGWRQLGFALLATGKPGEALGAFEQAVKLAPQDGDAISERGCARLLTGHFVPAAEDLTAALKIRPTYTTLIVWRYFARLQANQQALGLQEVEAFLKAYPTAMTFDISLAKAAIGKATPEELMQATKHAEPRVQAELVCHSEFVLGVLAELRNDAAGAKAHYTACVKTGQSRLPAFIGALMALSEGDAKEP